MAAATATGSTIRTCPERYKYACRAIGLHCKAAKDRIGSSDEETVQRGRREFQIGKNRCSRNVAFPDIGNCKSDLKADRGGMGLDPAVDLPARIT